METFLDKWFNRYNDIKGSEFPFRLPAQNVKISFSQVVLRCLIIFVISCIAGNLTALIIVGASFYRDWHTYLTSGLLTLSFFAKSIVLYTYQHFGFLLLIILPILTVILLALVSPKYYYWNRRAERLMQTVENEAAVSAVRQDVWPPPPSAGN